MKMFWSANSELCPRIFVMRKFGDFRVSDVPVLAVSGSMVKTGVGGRRVVWVPVESQSNGNLAPCWHRTHRTSISQASPCSRRPGGSSESSPTHCLACVQLPSSDDLSNEFAKTFLAERVAM